MAAQTDDSLAVLRGLRRPGDEAQLTRTLASVFSAEPQAASQFVRLVLERPELPKLDVPSRMSTSTEEVVGTGRLDLRFNALDWDVIVELKIHAGYGRGQLLRYLEALQEVPCAYLVAVTRDVPLYGEPPLGEDAHWAGSVRWRALLPGLRSIAFNHDGLTREWLLFLEVLEQEGSMGFTRPEPELFSAWSLMRQASSPRRGIRRDRPLVCAERSKGRPRRLGKGC